MSVPVHYLLENVYIYFPVSFSWLWRPKIVAFPSDAEIRAEMALRNEKVNGESGEGEEDAPEDTIEEEEEGEGGKGEASNEENGE